jgi:hypothetical protein
MDNEDGTISLMIGDGKRNVNSLPDILTASSSLDNAKVDEYTLTL